MSQAVDADAVPADDDKPPQKRHRWLPIVRKMKAMRHSDAIEPSRPDE
jgi:hypothetical protein